MLDERAALQLVVRLLQFFSRVHHDGPVPGHGLFERLARHQQEPDALIAGLDGASRSGDRVVFRPRDGLTLVIDTVFLVRDCS